MTEKSTPSASYLMWMGIALMVFGGIAIGAPAFAGKAIVYVIGAILMLTGIVQCVQGFGEESWSRKILGIVLGAITAICGLAVLAHPLFGLTMLTLVLAFFFVIEGIWKVVISFSYRPAQGWIAMLISGLLGFLLGFIIWRQWPISGMWAVGVLIGVDLLMTGISMVALAMTIKHVKKEIDEAVAP